MKLQTAFLAAAAAVFPQPGTAQPPLTLDQIFGAHATKLSRQIDSKWFKGGKGYTTIEPSAAEKDGSDVVLHDTATNMTTVLLSAHDLKPAGSTAPLAIEDYAWSGDGRYALILSNTHRLKRANDIGDYWLVDLQTKALRRIGAEQPTASLMYATFSPDSSRIAYVCNNNLYVEQVANGATVALTRDGSDHILNGTGDPVYEEEFDLVQGYKWSPDSQRIAYWHSDTSGVGTFHMIKNTLTPYPEVISFTYPKPGTTLSAVTVGTVSANGGPTTWFKLKGDPRQNYVSRMSWAGNSKEVLIQHENRAQNRNQVLIGNADDGSVRTVFVDSDAAWIDANADPKWLDHGKYFTWLSEKDGWRHLYLISRDGTSVQLRTPGAFDVVSVENIDEASGTVDYIASPDNVMQRYLYRTRLAGTPKLERLTPASSPGFNSYDVAPNGQWAFHTVSRFDTPPRTDLVSLPAHRIIHTISDNAAMHALVADTPHGASNFFKVKVGDGTELDGWMIKPPNFDPAKKYPLLVYVYSEPAGQTVQDRWGGPRYLWHLMLAQKGYIVASIDSRGAAAPRGRAWRKSIYRQIGILASTDQAQAVRALIAEHPYIDADRIGVWGWSGGGAMTLNAMFRYPDLYKTGIAVASPANQRLYNAIYQERYMSTPQDNPEGYKNGSPITFAGNLKGNLLLIQGTGDDNVHYQNMEQLVDALIANNKQFSMMAYPDRTHGISEKPNTQFHLFTLMTNYLADHLPAGGLQAGGAGTK